MKAKTAKQQDLPTMESRDLPEIEQAADRYRKIRDERCVMSKKESEAKSALIQVMVNKGRSFYSYNGLVVTLTNVENVKVKAKEEDDDEPVGRFTSRKSSGVTIEDTSHSKPAEETSDEERERLYQEATATWRGEPRKIGEERCAECQTKGGHQASCSQYQQGEGTPVETMFPQEEINHMAEYYAAQKISEEKPVKICRVAEEPHVITGCEGSGDGHNWRSVTAWPILPLANMSDEQTPTYKELTALQGKEPDTPFTYQNMRVNCGSAKKPVFWVMVGPEIKFTSRAFEADEADAQADTRCPECAMIDGGHSAACSKRPGALTFDDYLLYAKAHYNRNYQSYARKMELTRAQDDQVSAWVAEHRSFQPPKDAPKTRRSAKAVKDGKKKAAARGRRGK